jgi:hypothetical protein
MALPYIDIPNHFLSVNPIVVKKFAGLSAEHYTIYVKTHFQNQPTNSPGVKSSPPTPTLPLGGGREGWG